MNSAVPPSIDSRDGFLAAWRWGFHTAIAQGARRIVCVDADFAAWPLDETVLLQALTGWLRQPQRRLVLLARHFDEVPRRCPRFASWRRDWVHAIEAWQAPAELAAELPTLLLSDGAVCVQLFDGVRWRGRAGLDMREAGLRRQEVDSVLQRSEASFLVTPMGL